MASNWPHKTVANPLGLSAPPGRPAIPGPTTLPPGIVGRSPEWVDGYRQGLEDGRRQAVGSAVGGKDEREISTLKNTLREMEAELERCRAWEKAIMQDRTAGEGDLQEQLKAKSSEVEALRTELDQCKVQSSSDKETQQKLAKYEAEVEELRKALAECLESLRVKERGGEDRTVEKRLVSLESQIIDAGKAEQEIQRWQSEAGRMKMELNMALAEIHRLHMETGPESETRDALVKLSQEKEVTERRLNEELRHARLRTDELQNVLERTKSDQGLLDEARKLTQIERERGDALEQELEKMKLAQRESLEESESLVRSLQVRL